jgi:hypothetical protein
VTDPPIRVLDDLEAEFRRIADAPPHVRTRLLAKPRRPLATLVAVGALIMVSAAGAQVTGIIDISGDETAGLGGLEERRGIAEGTTDDGRRWLLSTARNGDTVCFALRVSSSGPVGTAENCGGITPGSLSAGAAHVGGDPVLFGAAPENASSIVIGTASRERTVGTVPPRGNVPGRFFVATVTNEELAAGVLNLIDTAGKPLGQPTPISLLLRDSSPVSGG